MRLNEKKIYYFDLSMRVVRYARLMTIGSPFGRFGSSLCRFILSDLSPTLDDTVHWKGRWLTTRVRRVEFLHRSRKKEAAKEEREVICQLIIQMLILLFHSCFSFFSSYLPLTFPLISVP